MITEDYVSFETAKLLKEKGFDGECDLFGRNDESKPIIQEASKIAYEQGIDDECVILPTLSMAMKWLRKAHNIHIEIGYNMGYFPVCISTKTNDTIPYIAMGSLFSYKKACEVAIKYCLENLV